MLDSKKLFMAPFCGETPCEDDVKKTSARCVQSGVCDGEGGEFRLMISFGCSVYI